MKIWIDAQLSPSLAIWINSTFGIESYSLKFLGLRDADDIEIFEKARQEEDIVIMTKDNDFLNLLYELGSPPKIIWITCGNTSNDYLKKILLVNLIQAIELLQSGERLVEIG
ncbi:MAG: DUF5615 family PIN-like protein [Leptospiraceae bacterium]|nr:DUF5615 family PIN-like protein [Leptospiraceae bacterium]